MTKNEVINRIKEISKEQISRGHSEFNIYQECKINVNEYFEISNLIYNYIDDKEKPKFLSLRDLLLVDGQMDCYDTDVDLVIAKVSTRIDELLK